MGENVAHRHTRQRDLVLEALEALRNHPTADEVHRYVRTKDAHVSLGTVYRNLDVLCRMGMAEKLECPGMAARFDVAGPAHAHVRCLGCDRVDDMPYPESLRAAMPAVSPSGVTVTNCRVMFEGWCPTCRAAKPAQ